MDAEDYPVPQELYETLEEHSAHLRDIEYRIIHIQNMERVFVDVASISLGPESAAPLPIR